MRRLFVQILLSCLTGFTAFSGGIQDSAKCLLSIEGGYNINSNTLTNELYNTVYTGGYIDNQIKERAYRNLKSSNRSGGDLNYGFSFYFKPDSLFKKKNNLGFSVSIKDRIHFHSVFSDDLLKLVLSGNSEFIGRSAFFNNTQLGYLHYQQIKFNFFRNKENLWINGAISYLKGQDFINLNINRGELFTKDDISQIYLNTAYNFQMPDTTKGAKKTGKFNGHGTSIDFCFTEKLNHSHSRINLEINDLGFIRWNKNSLSADVDTSFTFGGVRLNNILQLNDSNVTGLSQDSIKHSFLPYEKKSMTTILPAWIHLGIVYDIGKKSMLSLGIKYRINAGFKPLYYVSYDYSFNRFIKTGINLSYGGYGRMNTGIQVRTVIFKKAEMILHVNNFMGFIFPKKTFGQGLFLSLKYGF